MPLSYKILILNEEENPLAKQYDTYEAEEAEIHLEMKTHSNISNKIHKTFENIPSAPKNSSFNIIIIEQFLSNYAPLFVKNNLYKKNQANFEL